jgi:hypothetical protein
MRNLDDRTNILTLPMMNIGHSYIATPSPFTGRKEDYQGFRQQLRLYLTANRKDFQSDETMVIFALSYMTQGAAAKWADAYINKALKEDDWGKYRDFLDQLAHDFGDKEEPRKALEQMGRLYQGKGMASDYFQKLEQLAATAGIDIDQSPHILLQMEKGLNAVLIDQPYFSGTLLNIYREYKQRIINADDMCRRHKANCRKKTYPQKAKDLNEMEVDQKKTIEMRKCFICSKPGHLVRYCPDKERKQDF